MSISQHSVINSWIGNISITEYWSLITGLRAGDRIRTGEYQLGRLMPYHLATPARCPDPRAVWSVALILPDINTSDKPSHLHTCFPYRFNRPNSSGGAFRLLCHQCECDKTDDRIRDRMKTEM